MDPMTMLLAAAFAGGLAGTSEPVAPFYGCEVTPIAGTNAYQFVDPTCASAVTSREPDYITVEVEVAHGVFEEIQVSVDNK
jgi:hypothetical protein